MTNFEPLKKLIWDSARADDKKEFDKNCEALMEKAVNDLWRIGWELAPKDINDVYKMLDLLAKGFHEKWLEAMKCGDAPPEDVSPGEGPALIKKIIQDAVEGKLNDDSKGT